MRGALRRLRVILAEFIAPGGSVLFVPATAEESRAFFDVLDSQQMDTGLCDDPNCLCNVEVPNG